MGIPAPVEVHYRVDGPAGAPVLLLAHALGLSLEMWDPQMPRLTDDWRVVRYDHRGHGGSTVPPGPYRIDELGHDLVRLLDRLHLDRVSFCGLSLGGMVGIWLGAHVPDRIDRLMLCCTAPRMLRPEDYAARAQQVRSRGMASISDTVIGRWLTPPFVAGRPDVVARIKQVLLATPADGYAATCEALAAMDLREDLPRITTATLVLAGEADQATPPDQSREMATRIPGAELVVLPGAPHMASIEQPEAVGDQILRWLH